MYKSEEHDKIVNAFCNILPEKDLIAKLGIDSDTFRLWLRSYPTFAQAYLNGKCGVPGVYDLDNSKTISELKSTIAGLLEMRRELKEHIEWLAEHIDNLKFSDDAIPKHLKKMTPEEILVYSVLVSNKNTTGTELLMETKHGTVSGNVGEVFTTDAQILKQAGGMLTTAKIRGAVKSLISKGVLSKQAINLNGMLVGSIYTFL